MIIHIPCIKILCLVVSDKKILAYFVVSKNIFMPRSHRRARGGGEGRCLAALLRPVRVLYFH